MRALSIRQPYAELILRGIKTVEFRSRVTHVIGERFYLYAAKTWALGTRSAGASSKAWSRDLAMAIGRDAPPAFLLELGEKLVRGELPTGVIVGTAVIDRVSAPTSEDRGSIDGLFRWHLTGVERATTLRPPTRHPQPVWFEPF